MSLENLVKIGQLEPITPDAHDINRLLEAARRSLNDAQLSGLSAEGRFEMAYKAIMQSANAALQASGFTVHEDERGVLVDVNGSEPLRKIFQTLASHHLEYETADLVSCVYQG